MSSKRLVATLVITSTGCSGTTGEPYDLNTPSPPAEIAVEVPSLPPPNEPPIISNDHQSEPPSDVPPIRMSYLFQYSDYARRLLENNRNAYTHLGVQLDADEKYRAIHCDLRRIEGLEVGKKEKDFLLQNERAVYRPLCEAAGKIYAKRTDRGTQYLLTSYELEHLYIYVSLQRRLVATDLNPRCSESSYDQNHGHCDIVIDAAWSIGYQWEPFCLEGLREDAGC